MIARAHAAILVALLGAPGLTSAAADEAPADKLGLMVVRVLAYDHNLEARADGGDVVVAVVEGEGDGARACASTMTASLTGLARRITIARRPLRVARVRMATDKALSTALIKEGAVAVYACTSAADLPALARAARTAAALTFTTDPAALSDLAIGLVRRPDKIELQVNLVAARAEAAQLSGAFLRVATVVRR